MLRIFFENFPIGRKNCLTSPLSQYKNGIEWPKCECPSDIINFRCLLLKTDFRICYFELGTRLNKLVKLCGYFFQKKNNNFERKCRVLYFHQKSQPIS